MTTELDQVKHALRITREKLAERESLCLEMSEILVRWMTKTPTRTMAFCLSETSEQTVEVLRKYRTQLGE